MNIEYRSATSEEWPSFGNAVARGFGNHPPADEQSRAGWLDFGKVIKSVGAWDGDEVVGTSGAFTSDTTIPGGAKLPTAMVTIVTVSATHRRRGILTNMMSRLLKDAHERGEPMATLWASESVIYGRFGYGMAGQHYSAKIESGATEMVHHPEITGSVKFADRTRFREVGPGIWANTAAQRTGMPMRRDGSWSRNHPLPEDVTKPEKQMFYAVYEQDGTPQGYVAYKTVDKGAGNGLKDIRIKESIAATDEAHAGLWRFMLSVDLVSEIRHDLMALDDPLWWMLADPRQLKRTPYDAIWLRLLDVERALSARTYAEACDIVFAVEDEFCPWVGGSYRLVADANGAAECKRTDSGPDIMLPAASLATCYFGSVRFADLARAGRVHENAPDAMTSADRAFASEREPWCPLEY